MDMNEISAADRNVFLDMLHKYKIGYLKETFSLYTDAVMEDLIRSFTDKEAFQFLHIISVLIEEEESQDVQRVFRLLMFFRPGTIKDKKTRADVRKIMNTLEKRTKYIEKLIQTKAKIDFVVSLATRNAVEKQIGNNK